MCDASSLAIDEQGRPPTPQQQLRPYTHPATCACWALDLRAVLRWETGVYARGSRCQWGGASPDLAGQKGAAITSQKRDTKPNRSHHAAGDGQIPHRRWWLAVTKGRSGGRRRRVLALPGSRASCSMSTPRRQRCGNACHSEGRR